MVALARRPPSGRVDHRALDDDRGSPGTAGEEVRWLPRLRLGAVESKNVGGLVPFQLEAGGLSWDPDLVDGGVEGEDELGAAVVEEHVEHVILLFGLEAAELFFASSASSEARRRWSRP